MEICLSQELFLNAMDFSQEENQNWEIVLQHCIDGLIKEELIERDRYAYGNSEFIAQETEDKLKEPGIIIRPTTLGAQLFLWVYNKPNMKTQDFVKKHYQFSVLGDIKFIGKYVKIYS